MSRPSHFDQLRDAVQNEVSDHELRANRCDSFLEEIIRYQSGDGALPDEQQFLLWREDMEQTMAVRSLKSGVGLAAQDAAAPFDAPSAPRQAMLRHRGLGHGGNDSPTP